MEIILTREELNEMLKKAIQEKSYGKELNNPKITFLNKKAGDETDVESVYIITHISIE